MGAAKATQLTLQSLFSAARHDPNQSSTAKPGPVLAVGAKRPAMAPSSAEACAPPAKKRVVQHDSEGEDRCCFSDFVPPRRAPPPVNARDEANLRSLHQWCEQLAHASVQTERRCLLETRAYSCCLSAESKCA